MSGYDGYDPRETCPVCAIPWGRKRPCESPGCPCFRMTCGSPEMEAAAQRYRSRPGARPARTITRKEAEALIRQQSAAWISGRALSGADALRAELEDQREDYLTRYERARDAQDAEAEYWEAYQQAKAGAWLHGLYIRTVRHARGAS